MFTGIVEELGTVEAVEDQGDAIRLSVRATTVLEDAGLGDSISVNGCCLTVVSHDGLVWTADVMQETLDKTSLQGVQPGDRVNLERAVTAEKRLGGHIVQGHVDAVGHVVRRDPGDHWEVVTISLPPGLAPYLVDKGSVTVDGVSLTVNALPAPGVLQLSIIEYTWRHTTLGLRAPGDPVHVEGDVVGKYVQRLVAPYVAARAAAA